MFNKKAANSVLLVLILAGLLMAVVVFYFIYALVMPLISNYALQYTDITRGLSGTEDADARNVSTAINLATSPLYSIVSIGSWLGYFILICMFIGFLVLCFNIRASPYLGGIWIGAIVIIGLLSIWLSNAYIELKSDNVELISYYEANMLQDFFMTYMPHIVFAFGFISGIILIGLYNTNKENDLTGGFA